MRNILLVMKNNIYRLCKERIMLVMVLVVMPIVVCLGIYFNQTDSIKGKIAIVGANQTQQRAMASSIESNDKLTLEFLEKGPTKTELIKGIYLAEINFTKDEPEVISYGKEEVKKVLEANLKGEVHEPESSDTTAQGKIIGFLIIFLFFGSVMVMDYFLADRENGVYTRVLSGRISYYEYTIGQIVYSICVLSIPSTIWSISILKFLNVELTISYGLFTVLLLLVGILSSSFGMLIATIFKDRASASMGGSVVAMITCLLGGCLINIVDSNKIIGFIRNCIPQKRLIDLTNDFNSRDLIFVIGFIIVFILISVAIGKRHYENGEFV